MTVHLVNLTNPMMMRPSYRELIPSQPQQVRLRLPAGKKASQVQFLVKGGSPDVRTEGNAISLTVPSILDHEVIAVDLA
jgi:hypothetical protein